jgi:hypothetical protein
MVEKFGCRVEKVSRGKHFKFFLDTPSGKKILVCSVTSSDARAEANNRTLLRNWSRSNG